MPPPKDEKFRKRCPKCKDTDYNNRNFKLMINECGHSLCRHCVDTLFARNSGPCPTCGRTLLKKAFWEQTLDDPMIEKEVYWRKKFKDVFSIREENFPNLRAYNDFLEELEDKILDFVQEDSIDDAKLKRLEASRQEYSHLLLRGGKKPTADEEWIMKQLDDEKRYQQRINANRVENHSNSDESSLIQHDLIAEFRDADLPAEMILRAKKQKLEAAKGAKAAETTEIAFDRHSLHQEVNYMPIPKVEGEPFEYSPIELQWDGPKMKKISADCLKNIRAASDADRAGGYTEAIGCERALVDAFCDLFYGLEKKEHEEPIDADFE